eukprot:m.70933 g.70933  ORF g.70933 m.70933 type:complete len:451 (+) comp10040_c0_seq1:69-1421(+)
MSPRPSMPLSTRAGTGIASLWLALGLTVFTGGAVGRAVHDKADPPLPDGVAGIWSAPRGDTVLGPWEGSINFVVQPLNDSSGYMMSDHMGDSELIPGSYQRFWFQDAVPPAKTSVLVYCGQLATGYFSSKIDASGRIRFGAFVSARNKTSVTYTQDARGFSVSMTVTVISPTMLRIQTLFDQATHLDVTLTKVGEARVMDNPENSRLPDSGHSCELDAAALATQQLRPWSLAGGPLPPSPSTSQAAPPLPSGSPCPYIRRAVPVATGAGPHGPGDKVCVVIQPFVGLTMSWEIPAADATHLAITISAAVQNHGRSGSYFAVGFPSAMPSMANMTIAAVKLTPSGVSAVTPMFAVDPYGPPVERNEMPLTDTSATYNDGQLSFTFTRAMQNAFAPIQPLPPNYPAGARHRMAFASGPIDGRQMLEYHGGFRGVYAHEFFNPDAVWPADRFC